ncbi:hypothetical protein CVT24_000553 [Panaeolus cyanescens]|uniref:F-box domain-containing protein n=1 Tax=Panaeolus cyanescens TaxID=181874 RepID=A0A409VX91_9AGAR|nr:hypothetical protein CVT24_000553 [Panaeolus cyanescens]
MDGTELPVSLQFSQSGYTLQLATTNGSKHKEIQTHIDPLAPSESLEFNKLLELYKCSAWRPAFSDHENLTSSRAALNEILHQQQAQADGLAAQLMELAGSLLNTMTQIKHTQTQLTLCDSFASRIWTLPREIMAEILGICCQTTTDLGITRTPLVLRRVCRYWNNILSNQASSWSRLRLESRGTVLTVPDIERLTQALDVYRATWKETTPLSFGFFFDAPQKRTDQHLLNLLSPVFTACKHLYLGSKHIGWFYSLCRYNLPFHDLPHLQSLYLNFEVMDPQGNRMYYNAPNLTDLEVVLWRQEYCQLENVIPFSQLTRFSTTFHIDGFHWPQPISAWLNLCRPGRNLEVLEVNFKKDPLDIKLDLYTDVEQGTMPVMLPNLRRLIFKTEFSGTFMAFGQHFILPNLTHLTIDAFHPFHLVKHSTSIQDALNGSLSFFSGLVELELVRLCLSEEHVRSILETTTHLKKFTFMNYHLKSRWYGLGSAVLDGDFIFDLLAIQEGIDVAPLVPCLTELHFFQYLIGPYSQFAARYAALAKSRNTYLKTQDPSNAFRLHVTGEVFPYPNQTALQHLNRVDDAIREMAAGGLVTLQSEARRPFKKDIPPTKDWYSTIDPSYPAPL